MQRMLWLDLEMTGLYPEKDRILEVACIVTNKELEELYSWQTAVRQPQALLDGMDAWCQEHHGASGLLARVPTGMTEGEVDTHLSEVITTWFPKEKPILCGNSIWQDRRFIENYLPDFAKKLHYRMLDVSTLKLVFNSYFNYQFKKENKHLALDDVRESLAEFSAYRKFFVMP